MDKRFWLGRWERGEIGWHQSEPEEAMVLFFSKIAPTSILVPLCGKSLDLLWLAQKGFQVIGVELSSAACEAFFNENQLSYTAKSDTDFIVYQSKNITLFCGDFFNVSLDLFKRFGVSNIGALYDRAALIALPPEMREAYAKKLLSFIAGSNIRFLQVLLKREPNDLKGPPYSVDSSDLQALYGANFEIHKRTQEELPAGPEEGVRRYELVFELRPIAR